MAVALNKLITNVSATAGVWTVTLDDVAGIAAGMRIDVGGLPTSGWNVNNETVDSVNTTAKTVTYAHGNATVASTAAVGQLHLHCDWIDVAFAETLVGYTTSGDDLDYLTQCVEAANDWSFLRRQNAGYTSDLPNVAPGHQVKLGVAMYALSLFRAKGSVDQFASFSDTPLAGTVGTMGDIMRLLGINRGQVA